MYASSGQNVGQADVLRDEQYRQVKAQGRLACTPPAAPPSRPCAGKEGLVSASDGWAVQEE